MHVSERPNAHECEKVPWKYSFELKTQHRVYVLFAPNQEERDLWVNGFYRLLRVPIADENFIPMGTPNIEVAKISEESLLELAANDEDGE